MKWVLEMIGLFLVIAIITAWTKGPLWVGDEVGQMVASYRAATTCQPQQPNGGY